MAKAKEELFQGYDKNNSLQNYISYLSTESATRVAHSNVFTHAQTSERRFYK
nr:hypothetical protein [uncultured archaeon]